ncbi:zinc ribbon domain-containing protein [Methanobrevibacter sp.]|uniref:zinc ribbon domain-containing protein n=1 Tax=Methanobrevibacter sp. TaxID=66852 RepID=UPI0026DF68D2|nr:zinc ribbon domain-containing protein [Methanobrevibacter sp.]MDO5860239.1 zinc ribbon domain-containing protein [Methanobrevibacter sp.]
MMRRCPQCGATGDDIYGFCIKCGYEFQKVPQDSQICPLCGFKNPDEADFCVKCGTPLLFKNQFENAEKVKPIVIQKSVSTGGKSNSGQTSRLLIYIGYFFSIMGSIIGLIIGLYLITRKDPYAKKHGYIQMAIVLFYLVLLVVLLKAGLIPPEIIAEYKQLLAGNLTAINR